VSPIQKKPSEADIRKALRAYGEVANPAPEKGTLVDTTDSIGAEHLKPAPKASGPREIEDIPTAVASSGKVGPISAVGEPSLDRWMRYRELSKGIPRKKPKHLDDE
jgi:hypothetical protein